MDFLMKSQESLHANLERLYEMHREDIGALLKASQADGEKIRALVKAAEADGENIRALARIAESHEERLSRLEDGESPT
jgi:hypothetical protein